MALMFLGYNIQKMIQKALFDALMLTKNVPIHIRMFRLQDFSKLSREHEKLDEEFRKCTKLLGDRERILDVSGQNALFGLIVNFVIVRSTKSLNYALLVVQNSFLADI